MPSPKKISRKKAAIRIVEEAMLRGVDDSARLRELLAADHGLNVTERTVRNYKTEIAEHWRELNLEGAKTLGDRLERHYWHLYAEAISAWEASKEPKETELSETVEGGSDGSRSKAQIRTEGSTGDSRHWQNAERALAAIRKMRGLDEPERFAWETNLPAGYSADEVEDQFVRLLIEAERRAEVEHDD